MSTLLFPFLVGFLEGCKGGPSSNDSATDSNWPSVDSDSSIEHSESGSDSDSSDDTDIPLPGTCENDLGQALMGVEFLQDLGVTFTTKETTNIGFAHSAFTGKSDLDGSGVNDLVVGDGTYSGGGSLFQGRVYFFFDPLDSFAPGTVVDVDSAADLIITGVEIYEGLGGGSTPFETGDFLPGEEGDEVLLNYNGDLLLLYDLAFLRGEMSVSELYDYATATIVNPDHVWSVRTTGTTGLLDPFRNLGDVDGNAITDFAINFDGDCRIYSPVWSQGEVADVFKEQTHDLTSDYPAAKCGGSIQGFDFSGDGINDLINTQNSDLIYNEGDLNIVEGSLDLPKEFYWPSRFYPSTDGLKSSVLFIGSPQSYSPGYEIEISPEYTLFGLPKHTISIEEAGGVIVMKTDEISAKGPWADTASFVTGDIVTANVEPHPDWPSYTLLDFEEAWIFYVNIPGTEGANYSRSGIAYWHHPECEVDIMALSPGGSYNQLLSVSLSEAVEGAGDEREIPLEEAGTFSYPSFYGEGIAGLEIQPMGEALEFPDLIFQESGTGRGSITVLPGAGIYDE